MSARMTDLDLAVARRLRERRIVLGLTQQEVGDLAGVACQQVQNIRSRHQPPVSRPADDDRGGARH